MAAVSEYVLEPIRDGAEFALYRARQRGNEIPLLVVAPTAEQPLLQSLRRLEHEYSLAAELEPAWAVKPLALTRHEGRTILVLADPGGEPLDRILARDGQEALDVPRFLALAIGMATALGHVHQHGLIHKDVKPENVLVTFEPADDAGYVRLTGFGIASRLPRERQSPAPPEILAGALAYMSPEQTGRMNRSMDTRSDLYSLGVTLYQMLTGVLPFDAADPLEWVHCHIARQPVTPAVRREVPEPLSAIIMRLLAKNAEDRYQTAAGLVADLRRCLAQWQTQGRIDSFPLGADDLSDRLLIPEKLYGREREVDTLLAAFDRVVSGGRPELVLVSGYSGVGKSAVVHELHKSLISPRGLFAAGKFDQYKRDIPYATLAQAFQSLIHPILSKPEAELGKWRDDLIQVLAPNGSLLVDLVPELKLIIGEQPPVAPLPSQEAKTRSHLAFRRFLGVFARPEHPLGLFLDDLQWLDAATLDFLEDLLITQDPANQEDLAHLLVVGAYRDNEVDPAHPLTRKLSAIRRAGRPVEEIRLTPLGSGDLTHLIEDTLHCESQRAAPLAQLIHGKTAGNPFFAIQFIYALAEEALITFEHAATRWRWDLDAIRIKGYTDNVVDLMVAKLNRLPAKTQKALQQLACIGSSAETSILAAVLETSEQETEAALWEALQLELIVRSEDSWRFVHDRVQEAAYSLIAEEAGAEAHLRIGRLLQAHIPPEKREEAIFEIVNQYNRGAFNDGAGLITSENERFQVAELNLVAGQRAKASTANASALKYFIAGEALLTNDVWEHRHELIFQLELRRAECEFLTGEAAIAAERLEALRSRALNIVDLAMATCLGIDVYMTLGQIDRAVTICLDYLRHLNIDWPVHPTEEHVRSEYERVWSQLGSRAIEEIIDFPLMRDPASIATLDVLSRVSPAAVFTDTNLSALIICRAVSLNIERGNNDGSCLTYVVISNIAGHRFGDYRNAFRFAQLGYDLVEKRGLKRFQAATWHTFAAMIMPWMKHPLVCCGVIREAFGIANRIGDLTYAVYACMGLIGLLIAAGDPLAAVQSEAGNGLNFAQKARFAFGFDTISMLLGFIRTLRGLTTQFGSFDHAEFDEADFERNLNNPMTQFWYWVRKLQARFFAGDFASAIEASLKARPLLWASPTVEMADYEFYSALARAACCDAATGGQSQENFEALGAHYRRLQVWAENCPENFENRAALVAAEIARIEGRALDAIELYEQAIRSARANGFVHNEAAAWEVAAQFYASRGFETIADAYLRNARTCYDRWGAHGKVKQLDERHPRLREGRPPYPSATIDPPVGQLDVETVVKASQTISSEMVPAALIEKLVRIAMENAGAERGLLILIHGGEPRIEAEATTGPGKIEVAVRQVGVMPSDLPQSALHYVIRTQESLLLDDASADNLYSKDEYVRQKRSRSVLCLPIVKQAKLLGALYLENSLTAGAFTPDGVTVLQLLASQAAISLENASLYSDLELQAGLLQNLPVSAWTLKPDGTPDFVNQVWLDYSGQTLDFVRSRPEAWMTAVHPEDREAASKAFWNGISSGLGFAFETRSLRAEDGTWRWHLNQAVVLRDAEGKVLKFVGTTTDIDDQKRAEEKARESEYEARLTVDSIPGMVAVVSTSGEVMWLSKPLLDYYGKSLEEVSSQWTTGSMVHPEDRPGLIEAFTRSLASGDPTEFELRACRFDGVYRWFDLRGRPLRDRQGRIARWYFLQTDIDDQKRAEEAFHESEYEARLIVDSIPGLVCTLNPAGQIDRANRPLLDFFGMTVEELNAWGTNGAVHPDDLPGVIVELTDSMTTGTAFDSELRYRRADGLYRWSQTRILPVRDTQGRITRWYGLITDIEDRKRAEEKLRESEYEARLTVDSIPGMVAVTNASGEVMRLSKPLLDYYSKSPEEINIQWAAEGMVHPEDRPGLIQAFTRSLASGDPTEFEFRACRFDGVYRWFVLRGRPLRDRQGRIVRWYFLQTDIDDQKRAEEKLRESEYEARLTVDSIPGMVGMTLPSGNIEMVSRQALEFFGKTIEELRDWGTNDTIHPEDLPGVIDAFTRALTTGRPYEFSARFRRADGVYRWLQDRGSPLRNKNGDIARWYLLITDIDDQKRTEEALRESEHQSRLIVDSIPGLIAVISASGELERVSQPLLDYFGKSLEEMSQWAVDDTIHPDDRPGYLQVFERAFATGDPVEYEAIRVRRFDGVHQWLNIRGLPLRDRQGQIVRWYFLLTDVDDRKRAEEALRESEHESRLIVDSIPGMIAVLSPSGELERLSKPVLDYFGRSQEEMRQWAVDDTIHPDDRAAYLETFGRCLAAGNPFEYEAVRNRRFDGVYRWLDMRGLPLRDRQGQIVRWYFLLTDVDDRKRAEDKIRQSEKEARQLLDLSPLQIAELRPDGARIYNNRPALDYHGITLEEWQEADLQQLLHPQDATFVAKDLPEKLQRGLPFEYEARLRRKDGQYRWFHYRLSPVSDDEGRITRWYAAGTDIDDRKLAEQRLQEENVVLREEVDKASMFEEIVGTSAPLKKVLSRISRVAPTDSSVLITGETGTGKELVARAIHRRSRRSTYPFVSLNCAAIPRDLIASELFGHESGAFTGATQRRLGRFELAAGGTLFLDEVGELPAETQITLLRVLQEHEFERIGGVASIRVDVRVIAATNRDLEEAIRAGTFRSDLFYRLNVFPVEMPTLRERKEDIPLLLRYFLDRYGMKAGKIFKTVDKRSLDLLQSYPWPGNIRELQNVIERSVIVSEMETFSVDESWLSRTSPTTGQEIRRDPFRTSPAEERAIIEAALRECGGRIYGPAGAAEKLGIPRSTLESKIRTLKINKNRFRGPLPD